MYLALIVQHAKTRRVVIEGYCLMPNHVHLILTPLRENAMGRVLRDTNGRYATASLTRFSHCTIIRTDCVTGPFGPSAVIV